MQSLTGFPQEGGGSFDLDPKSDRTRPNLIPSIVSFVNKTLILSFSFLYYSTNLDIFKYVWSLNLHHMIKIRLANYGVYILF